MLIFLYNIFNYKRNIFNIFVGDFLNLELGVSLKSFFSTMGCSNYYYNNNLCNDYLKDFRFNYLLNMTLIDLENLVNVLLIGVNPRLEVPLLNARLRKNYLNNFNFKVFSIGLGLSYLTYPVINLGSSIKTLLLFLEGKLFSKKFYLNDFFLSNYLNKKNLLNLNIFFGTSFLDHFNLSFLYSYFLKLTNNIGLINRFMGRMTFSELNLTSNFEKLNFFKKSFNFFCNVDLDLFFFNNKLLDSFNIYQGIFYHSFLSFYFDLILPVTNYLEDYLSYLNLEGRIRSTNKIVSCNSKVWSE